MKEKQLSEMLEEEFKENNQCPISVKDLTKNIDFEKRKQEYQKEERRKKEYFHSFSKKLIPICVLILCLGIGFTYFITRNWGYYGEISSILSEEEITYSKDNCSILNENVFYEITVKYKFDFYIYVGITEDNRNIYFYKLIYKGMYSKSANIKVNGEELTIDSNNTFGILYSYAGSSDDDEYLDIYIKNDDLNKHYVFENVN